MRKHLALLLILKALDELGEAPISTVQKQAGLGNYYTTKQILQYLKEKGIVEERYDPGPPGKFIYKLTEKGNQTAEHAKAILELMGIS